MLHKLHYQIIKDYVVLHLSLDILILDYRVNYMHSYYWSPVVNENMGPLLKKL